MMLQKQPELLWVVVEVASGIPVTVEVYQDKQSAGKREQLLRAHMHPENDETGVFEVQIEHPVPLASESSSPK
jgi:hypothetical protein